MYSLLPSLLALPLLTLLTMQPAGQADKPLSKPFVDGVRAEAHKLLVDVERLQEEVIFDPATQKDRDLYKLTDEAIAAVVQFERTLKSASGQERLLKQLDELDGKLRQLVAVVRKAAPDVRIMQRTADHVDRANEELYYALASGDSKRAGQITERQAHTFTGATRDLEHTARYALGGGVADRAVLIDNAANLAIAAERFEKSLQNKGDRQQRQGDFADVDKAWVRTVSGLGLLKPAEYVHLLRSAARVDRLHERMYRLLEIKGTRPSLDVQS